MRIIISVTNKKGLDLLGRCIVKTGGTIISSGGTAKEFERLDIPVTLVEEVTGFPEILSGRVKTIHPKIAGGLLADRKDSDHLEEIALHSIDLIDAVVVDLYPLHQAILRGAPKSEVLENVDIGGVLQYRCGLKPEQIVICDPNDYPEFIAHLIALKNFPRLPPRPEWRLKAFRLLSGYDSLWGWWEHGGKAGDGTIIGDMLSLLDIHPEHYPTTASFFEALGGKIIHARSHR